jgi:phage terminase small subunit
MTTRIDASQMTVIDLLLEQHALIEELFQLVETSEGEAKQAAFDELAALLQMHEAAEAELVHPLAAQDADSGEEVINARLEEEDEAKDLLAGLMESGIGAASFDPDFQALRAAVLEHATREERYEFNRLKAIHPSEFLRHLAEEVREFQAAAARSGATGSPA